MSNISENELIWKVDFLYNQFNSSWETTITPSIITLQDDIRKIDIEINEWLISYLELLNKIIFWEDNDSHSIPISIKKQLIPFSNQESLDIIKTQNILKSNPSQSLNQIFDTISKGLQKKQEIENKIRIWLKPIEEKQTTLKMIITIKESLISLQTENQKYLSENKKYLSENRSLQNQIDSFKREINNLEDRLRRQKNSSFSSQKSNNSTYSSESSHNNNSYRDWE